MKHHDRSLVIILIAALFSLAGLQGLNLLIKYSSVNILGDTTACKNNYYQCTTDNDCCSNYCNPLKKVCINKPVQTSASSTGPISIPTFGVSKSVPCDEINRLQKQYCSVSVSPTTAPYPTGIGASSPTPRSTLAPSPTPAPTSVGRS